MSARPQPKRHAPAPITGLPANDPTLRYLQNELRSGKLIGTGQDGDVETSPFSVLLGLEVKRNTPDLLLTSFSLNAGLQLLDMVATLSEGVDYAGKNVVIPVGGKPGIAILGQRNIARKIPRGISEHYAGRPFRLVQCFLADKAGLFPWDADFSNPYTQYYWGYSRYASWDQVPLNGLR